MPYKNVTSYRDIVVSCKVKHCSCAVVELYGNFAPVACLCVCDTACLIEHILGLEFVSERNAVEVLEDKFLCSRRSKFALGNGCSELEIFCVNVL